MSQARDIRYRGFRSHIQWRMNRTNCFNSFATDTIFHLPSHSETCADYLPTFLGVCSLIIFFRFSTAVSKTHRGMPKLKEIAHYLRAPSANEPPPHFRSNFGSSVVILVTSWLSSFIYIFMLVLTGTNVINVFNGGGFLLFCFSYLTFFVDISFTLYKLVRLGENLIPLRNVSFDSRKELSKFNALLMSLVFIQVTLIFIGTLCFILLIPISPNKYQQLGMLGFASFAAFHFLASFSIVYQHERCVNILKAFLVNSTMETSPENQNVNQKVRAAIGILRTRQAVIFLGANLCFIVFVILASGRVAWTWELIFLGLALPESIINFCFEFFYRYETIRKKALIKQKQQKQISTIKSSGHNHEEQFLYPIDEYKKQNSLVKKLRRKSKQLLYFSPSKLYQNVLSMIKEESDYRHSNKASKLAIIRQDTLEV